MALVSGVLAIFGRSALMPLSPNILVRSGIGALTLHDTRILHLNHVPPLPTGFWLVVTAIGLLGAAFLIALLLQYGINLARRLSLESVTENDAVNIFLLLSGMIYLLPILISGFFDRYMVPAIPLFAAGITNVFGHFPRSSAKSVLFASAVLAAFVVFATGSTRDYLTWSGVRWKALRSLMKDDHIPASKIDGGFEFNGLFMYDSQFKADPKKSWWWVQDDTYQIAFGHITGYDIIKEYWYDNWIPPRLGKIVVLQRRVSR